MRHDVPAGNRRQQQQRHLKASFIKIKEMGLLCSSFDNVKKNLHTTREKTKIY